MRNPQRPLATKRYRDIDLAPGMRVKDGIYGYIEVTATYKGRRKSKSFAQHVPLTERLAWQHQAVEQMRLAATYGEPDERTLAQDIDLYLGTLKAASKRQHCATWLRYWRAWYGHLKRQDLTVGQVQAFFEYVRPIGREREFAASSKNHLRSVLIGLYRYFDGRQHACPASEVPLFPEPVQATREISPERAQAILAHMEPSPNRARAAILFLTGCRPVELESLTPDAFQLEGACVSVTIRGAKGGADRIIPLPLSGVRYARDFVALSCWRKPRAHTLQREMRKAARKAGVPKSELATITPYALRHAYAMNLKRSGAGIDDIANALGHKSLQTTRRYAKPIPEVAASVAGRMWERIGLTETSPPPHAADAPAAGHPSGDGRTGASS